VTCFNDIIDDLFEWKYEELAKGSRIKASIIHKVELRIWQRRADYLKVKNTRFIYC
jgi:hypothetical protein